jgi:Fic family protein
MKRRPPGTYERTAVAGERVDAFVPSPLPPDPPVDLGGRLQVRLERAHLALGRLDSVSSLLPDTKLLLYMYVRKEAVLSSQIEGTQSSLSDLLLFELDEVPGVPLDDVVEASNYVAALEHGLDRLRGGFPLSNRLFREVHAVLLSRGRGSDKDPGEFRRTQNWIGGARPGRAQFIPPPPNHVAGCMSDLERFLHTGRTGLPALLVAGLAHAQFETIHPFLDGNGRIGRLLITLLLCDAGVLGQPMLYLSLYLKQNRAEYYERLNGVRRDGTWEKWLEFFLDGVADTADQAVETARRIIAILDEDRARLRTFGRSAGSAARVHRALSERAILSIGDAAERSGLSFPATAKIMGRLEAAGLVRELTGRKRDRLFGYERYLAVLAEGTEPL